MSRHVLAAVEDVFDILVRPETYPEWLVGAREIRSVDAGWPSVGSCFHHRVGLIGPITVADSTEVLAIEEPRRLVLEVRARPFGRGRVTFSLEDVPLVDGRPCTRITLDEVPIGALAPATPLLNPLVEGRNIASLNALVAYLNSPPGLTPDRSGVSGRDRTASGVNLG